MSKGAKKFQAENGVQRYVEVTLPIPLRQSFTYSIPPEMRSDIRIGSRLIVPFRNRRLTGYAVSLSDTLNKELGIEMESIKPAIELLDHKPLITQEILNLTRWAAGYYASSWGEMLKASLPAGINATIETEVRLTELGRKELETDRKRKTQKRKLLKSLADDSSLTVKKLKKKFGSARATRALNDLVKSGFVEKIQKKVAVRVKPKIRKAVRLSAAEDLDAKEVKLTTQQKKILDVLKEEKSSVLLSKLTDQARVGPSPVKTLAKRGLVEIFEMEVRRDPLAHLKSAAREDITLSRKQTAVYTQIENALVRESYKTFLLHGVTGSGKTEIYIHAMRQVLERGKSSLMLVPEIALTPVFSKRLRAAFGDEVAILHSSLSSGERFDEWRRIRNGDAKVVIGTRSAIFAPLQNIGLIVIDEEHDTSYRQHEMPFYNARDVAIVRAKNADAVAILGSATPALESFHNAHLGKYDYLNLPKRFKDRPMAKAEVIDMREVFKEAGKDLTFSEGLESAIDETYEKGEQSIILLNRRGFSQFVLCRSCGERIKCKNCDITLTFHKRDQRLVCHYCNFHIKVPTKCPSCKGEFLFFVGDGTEQIENVLSQRFPKLKIARIDRDTTRKPKQLEKLLSDFENRKTDVLVGTQMIAKGHDFPNVTLVGVVSVDMGLSLPEFRAAERTFQLLTQVAGRAGRGDLSGKVLIQTYYPEHYALKHAQKQDYDSFYKEEIEFRKRMHYPPFVAMASIMIKHPNYNYASGNADILRRALDKVNPEKHCIVLGPAPAPLSRLKGEHRLQILIKSRSRNHLRNTIEIALAEAEAASCDTKIAYVEIDPVNLL